jgi:hypothetical protein
LWRELRFGCRPDCNDPKHCNLNGELKPRRTIALVRLGDFLSSLAHLPDGRHIFSGILSKRRDFDFLRVRVAWHNHKVSSCADGWPVRAIGRG